MGRIGGEAAWAPTTKMAGYPPATTEDLHRVRAQSDLAVLTGELIGNAVVMAVDLEVVIDADLRHLPGGELVESIRKRLQRRPVQALEQAATASRQLLEGAVIEPGESFGDDRIRLGDREEGEVADAGQDPALGHQHPGLDLGLVSGLARAGGDDGTAVVLGQLLVGAVQLGLVAVTPDDADLEVVGNPDLRDAAQVLEGVDMGARSCSAPAHLRGVPRRRCSWRPPVRRQRTAPG